MARKDLAEKMLKFKPKAIRWPGGNDLVGATIASRFQWNNTLGPLIDRPGRLGNWAAGTPMVLVLLKCTTSSTRLALVLLLVSGPGVDANGNSVPEADLEPYIQQQVDFVHFLLDKEGQFADLRQERRS